MEIAVDSMDVIEFAGGGNSDGIIKVPITVIAAGVANGALRDKAAVKKSTPLWDGLPIIRAKVGGIDDHPPEKIVTCRKQIVGQVKNPVWDEENGKIHAEAWFSDELGSPPELMEFVGGGGKLGVSPAYFHETVGESGELNGDKYNVKYYNLVPNNSAIVEYPACPLGTCGINVEHKETHEVKIMVNEMNIDMDELVSLRTESATAKVAAVESERIKKELGEKVIALESDKAKIIVERDELVKRLADVAAERDELKAKVDAAAVESKKQEFLGKFPEESKVAAESELLAAYMGDPAKFVIEHGARYAELLVGNKVAAAKEAGKTMVPELDSEAQIYEEIGLPDMKEIFGIKA